jgi:hypothetical protein
VTIADAPHAFQSISAILLRRAALAFLEKHVIGPRVLHGSRSRYSCEYLTVNRLPWISTRTSGLHVRLARRLNTPLILVSSTVAPYQLGGDTTGYAGLRSGASYVRFYPDLSSWQRYRVWYVSNIGEVEPIERHVTEGESMFVCEPFSDVVYVLNEVGSARPGWYLAHVGRYPIVEWPDVCQFWQQNFHGVSEY